MPRNVGTVTLNVREVEVETARWIKAEAARRGVGIAYFLELLVVEVQGYRRAASESLRASRGLS